MNFDYVICKGYLVPCLTTNAPELPPLGMYGEMRRQYLENHQPFLYDQMTLEGNLYLHLHEIDSEAHQQVNNAIRRLAAARGIDEQFKRRDPLGWAREMANIKSSAEEMVLPELIYAEEYTQ